jgi:plasmid maintenance system killer protein
MHLEFSTGKLRKELSQEKAMDRAYGDRAKPLRRRLDVLRRATCLADVPKDPPDRCHRLSRDRDGQYAVVIKDNWRLVFVPDHEPVPKLSDGGVDERSVTRITVLEVVDYH